LLDVGVRPYPDAIFKMYRHMKVNANVGAVCGYMRLVEEMVMDEEYIEEEDIDCMTHFLLNFFDTQRAQQIESHYEHFLDKSFEALFRFIHVVPGSFSAYNMRALRAPDKKDELLRSYFRTIDEKVTNNKIVPSEFTTKSILARVILPKTIWKRFFRIDPDSEEQMLYNENTYMAANRVLCLGIHKNGKDIAYLPNVYAQVEPIKRINDLMEEKRKEFNGGMFSF
jgi:cellulose synthase/poly-beta-1,6-N-acetylglucosamine synthase-like glycosyltransferase